MITLKQLRAADRRVHCSAFTLVRAISPSLSSIPSSSSRASSCSS
ncbi:MAG: hypothetical protein HY955_06030 [Deltaproteobacteria bacterium]|nr:hypothetical protein [Deltaproteobacteria bacterium]